MFGLLKKRTYPIGVDISGEELKMAQLRESKDGIIFVAGAAESCPVSIEPASSEWQRWAIDTLKNMLEQRRFSGKDVIAAIPPSEVFIEHIKVSKTNGKKLDEVVIEKAKQKLPIELDNAMVKYIPAEEDNFIVIAADRQNINRHLAIYENAGMNINTMGVWPGALTNTYVKFFGRRKTDLEAVVMLLDICRSRTNLVICRHKNLLFAKSISIGFKHLDNEQVINRLVMEIDSSRGSFTRQFSQARPERLVFISGSSVDRDVCTSIARQIKLPAQIGDCLSAVQIKNGVDIERRNSQFSWASSFGLSMSEV